VVIENGLEVEEEEGGEGGGFGRTKGRDVFPTISIYPFFFLKPLFSFLCCAGTNKKPLLYFILFFILF
jgi:hypothetical protein